MKTLTAPELAALSAPEIVTAQVVRLGFSPTPVALAASTWALTHGGTTYKAAQGLGQISPIDDSPGDVKGMQFEMTGAPADYISLALDGADEFQGVPIAISTALLDPATYQIVSLLGDWSGYGDTFTHGIEGQAAAVVATGESSAVDLLRGVPQVYNDGDQQIIYPGDVAFQYVESQSDVRDVWPSREFFFR
jgi:hypothetical protein